MTRKPDLRDGKQGATPSVDARMPGAKDRVMPLPRDGEHAVNPGVGSTAGMAEGQVTKSN